MSEVPPALVSMVKMLAEASEEQRRTMLETRLKEFANMADEERVKAMAQMIKAVATLDPEKRVALAKSRIDCLCEKFDEATRKKLMATHMKALMSLSHDLMHQDMESMFAAMPKCSDNNRTVAMQTMKSLIMEMPKEQRESMLHLLPQDVRKMMGV